MRASRSFTSPLAKDSRGVEAMRFLQELRGPPGFEVVRDDVFLVGFLKFLQGDGKCQGALGGNKCLYLDEGIFAVAVVVE